MKKLKPYQKTPQKGKLWRDNTEQDVPIVYISKSQKVIERKLSSLVNQAFKIEMILAQMRCKISAFIKDIQNIWETEENQFPVKTNSFVIYNFDKSLKVIVTGKVENRRFQFYYLENDLKRWKLIKLSLSTAELHGVISDTVKKIPPQTNPSIGPEKKEDLISGPEDNPDNPNYIPF